MSEKNRHDKKQILHDLGAREILQINVTLIAGVLILLSISNAVVSSPVFKISSGNQTFDAVADISEKARVWAIDLTSRAVIALMGMTAIGFLLFSSVRATRGNIKSSLHFFLFSIVILLILFSFVLAINYAGIGIADGIKKAADKKLLEMAKHDSKLNQTLVTP